MLNVYLVIVLTNVQHYGTWETWWLKVKMLGCHLVDSEFDLWSEFCAYFCANILKLSSLPKIPSVRFKSCLLTTILMSNRIYPLGLSTPGMDSATFPRGLKAEWSTLAISVVLEIIQSVWGFIDLYLETGMYL